MENFNPHPLSGSPSPAEPADQHLPIPESPYPEPPHSEHPSRRPLRIFSVMNSFKESMSSKEANEAVFRGLQDTQMPFEWQSAVFADGGQGTLDALREGRPTQIVTVEVHDACRTPKTAHYFIDESTHTAYESTHTAYMEMAQAAPLTEASRQMPLQASTYGVGEMIADALDKGARHFVMGLGGSATTDGGKDMLEALGWRFLDEHRQPVVPGNAGLIDIRCIDDAHVRPELNECTFEIACDVENPLLGPHGSAAVFGPQKGITPSLYPAAEAAMNHWNDQSVAWANSRWSKDSASMDDSADSWSSIPGTGAAGGLGFAFVTYLQGQLKSGADLVIENNHILESIEWADFVITGEGRFDFQSLDGKGPGRIIDLAHEAHKKVLVFAGSIDLEPQAALNSGADGFYSILQGPSSLEQALRPDQAAHNLRQSVFEVFLLVKSMQAGL